MKIKQIIFISTLVSIFTLGTNIALAEKGSYSEQANAHKMCKKPYSYKGKGMHGMKYKAQQLGLSDEQKTKIIAIKKEKREVIRSLRKQMYEIKKQLAELNPKNPNFKTEIFSLAAKKGVLAQRMVVEKGEMRFKIASLLTTEQLAEKEKMRQQKHHMCQHGKHQCKLCKKGLKDETKKTDKPVNKIKEI